MYGEFIGVRGKRRRRKTTTVARRRTYNRKPRINTGLYGIELKFYDQSLVGQALVTNTDGSGSEFDPSATIGLSTIIQGDSGSNRDGRRATFWSMFVNGSIDLPVKTNQVGGVLQTEVFICLVLDKQTNGIQIQSESVYLNVGGATGTGTLLQRNLVQSKRFTVLKTVRLIIPVVFSVFDGTNIEQYGTRTHWSLYHRFRTPVIANYSGDTEDIANSTDNSIHLLAFTSAVISNPTISYSSRLRFRG